MLKNIFLFIATITLFSFTALTQLNSDPWTESDLISTKDLADKITEGKDENTLILGIGFDSPIKNSIEIGAGNDPANIDKLAAYLKDVPKDKEIVIYCGCCPFQNCPNIRPAFTKMQELGFTNFKLLDVPNNIKTDWFDKDYPFIKQ